MAPVVTPTSRVWLRPLVVRFEDGEYVVGSLDSGEFVVLPAVGRRVIELLGADRTVAEVRDAIEAEYGVTVDLPDFVDQLAEVGFVAQVDGERLPEVTTAAALLPRLRARHVAWLASRPAILAYLTIVLTAVVLLVTSPESRPGSGTLVAIPSTSVLLLLLAVVFTVVVSLHELGHLVAARGLGLPARVSLTTRLYLLTARTEVPCLWAVARRRRYLVYLAGIAVDLLVFSLAVIIGSLWEPLRAPLGIVAIVPIINLVMQLQLYLKTDLYLVVADLTRARNLFADSAAYLRYLIRRRAGADPSAALPSRERRAVRVYAALMVIGTVLAIAFYLFVVVPAMVAIATRGVGSIRHGLTGGGLAYLADGVLTIAIQAGYYALFLRTWWRRRSG